MSRRGSLPEFADLVRNIDRPRYYATLLSPAASRLDLLAVAGLRCELAAVAGRMSEASLGEIRLQWWRDSLQRIAGGGDAPTPLLRGLAAAMGRHRLPASPLVAMAEAYRRDLYSDPPPSTNDLDGFLGETDSAVFQLQALILGAEAGETADAAGHAGIAYGLARRLSVLGRERARGRSIVPADLLERHKLAPQDVFEGAHEKALTAAVRDLAAHAGTHHRRALAALEPVSRAARVAFLPLAAVRPLLAAVVRSGPALFRRDAHTSDAALLLRMARAAFL